MALKVLHVYRTYYPDPPGGLQEGIRQICLAVQPFGVENTVFTLSPSPHPADITRPEGRVVRARSWGAPASCDVGGLAAFLRFQALARDADVVHYFFPWPFADLLHHVVRPTAPAVMTYISDIVRQRWLGAIYRPLMRKTLASVSAIVANAPAYPRTSEVLRDRSIRRRLRVIPLGIAERSYPEAEDSSILNKLGLSANEPFFLFVGVLRYYKGLHNLVQAASSVRAKVVIAGSGPEADSLQRLVQGLSLRHVLLAGQISDEEKVALFVRCRAVVLPSNLRAEAYGMVLVEAAMFGRPMISCEIGTGTSFINVNGKTGLVVPPDAPDELADAMNRLLHDDHLAGRMGVAARRRYERHFSGRPLGQKYAALFHSVAGAGGRKNDAIATGSLDF